MDNLDDVSDYLQLQQQKCVDDDKKHGELLPSSVRGIISGRSACGKTNVLIRLLTDINGLKFENIYLYAKSLLQPKYALLREIMKPIKGVGYFEFDDNEQVIRPSEAKTNSIFIFDDIMCEKQDRIGEFYCMGRHGKVDCVFLAQSYAKINKHMVRDNCNLLILFRQDELNLKKIFNEHVIGDMSYNEFKTICFKCWKEPYDFIVIIKDYPLTNGRYRKGFDHYISL